MTTKNYSKTKLSHKVIKFWLKNEFKISRGSKKLIKIVDIQLIQGHIVGKGECIPYDRYEEKLRDILKYLKENNQKILTKIKQGKIDTIPYLSLQNALSTALIDIECQKKKRSFIKNNNIPLRFSTAVTVSIFGIKRTKAVLKKLTNVETIKIKLNQSEVFEKLELIQSICKNSKIIIDANESWSSKFLKNNISNLEKFNIILIEQPFPKGKDFLLKYIKSKIKFCADETFHLKNKNLLKNIKYYQCVNLKLDKFGTHHEIIKYITIIKKLNKKIMLGCMVSSSLSILPALRYFKYSDFIDLDGAVFLEKDRYKGIVYKNGVAEVNPNFNWGKKKGL